MYTLPCTGCEEEASFTVVFAWIKKIKNCYHFTKIRIPSTVNTG